MTLTTVLSLKVILTLPFLVSILSFISTAVPRVIVIISLPRFMMAVPEFSVTLPMSACTRVDMINPSMNIKPRILFLVYIISATVSR